MTADLSRPAVPGRLVRLAGLDVHVERHGERGPVVLLLHHFHGNTRTWRRLYPLLSDRARLVAFDRPGFGWTDRPDRRRPYTRAAAVRIAVALLDHLEVEQAVVVGASAGGTVAIETALAHPDRVAALGLVSPAITGDVGPPSPLRPLLRLPGVRHLFHRLAPRIAGELTIARVTRSWADPTRGDGTDLAAYRDVLGVDNWARGTWWSMTAEASPSLRGRLGELSVPTLVVAGDRDRTISPRSNQVTARAIPGAELRILPGCGHTPHEECPEALAAAIDDLVDTARGEAA